jgi:hypothetical protein
VIYNYKNEPGQLLLNGMKAALSGTNAPAMIIPTGCGIEWA